MPHSGIIKEHRQNLYLYLWTPPFVSPSFQISPTLSSFSGTLKLCLLTPKASNTAVFSFSTSSLSKNWGVPSSKSLITRNFTHSTSLSSSFCLISAILWCLQVVFPAEFVMVFWRKVILKETTQPIPEVKPQCYLFLYS